MQNNIGEARRSFGLTLPSGTLTQDEAAVLFGVAPSTYKKWEQGQGKLNGEILCMIADKFGCSVDYLLMRTTNPEFTPVRIPRMARDEQKLLNDYRSAPEAQKPTILAVVETISGDEREISSHTRRAA